MRYLYRVEVGQTAHVLDLPDAELFDTFQKWLENDDPARAVKSGYRIKLADGSHTLLNFRHIAKLTIVEDTGAEGQLRLAGPPVPFTVKADQQWQPSGIRYTGGLALRVRYVSGLWRANPARPWYDAYGDPNIPIANTNYIMPGFREGALVIRIGPAGDPNSSPPMLIPPKPEIPIFWTKVNYAELFFVMNDDIDNPPHPGAHGLGFKDNQGAVNIELTQSWN